MEDTTKIKNPFGCGFYMKNEKYHDMFTQHLFWKKYASLIVDKSRTTLCGKVKIFELGETDCSEIETLEQMKQAVFAPYNKIYMCKSCLRSFKKYLKTNKNFQGR